MTYAQKTARLLERQRVRLLGAGALVLTGDAGQTIATISDSFFISRKSNLTLGEEYLEAEIAECSFGSSAIRLTDAQLNQTTRAAFQNVRYNVSATEDLVTAARVFKLRLTPQGAKNTDG